MKKITKLLFTIAFTTILFILPIKSDAASNQVHGESFYTIAKAFNTTNLQIANQISGHTLVAGDWIKVPDYVSIEDKELMASLVHAEAKGEPYAGKVGVASVVLNRVDHKEFPNTIPGVIYEQTGGTYAFTPVQNGEINGGYTKEDMKAVEEAIAFRGQGNGSIYFYNPDTAISEWIFTRETIETIGNHRFAK